MNVILDGKLETTFSSHVNLNSNPHYPKLEEIYYKHSWINFPENNGFYIQHCSLILEIFLKRCRTTTDPRCHWPLICLEFAILQDECEKKFREQKHFYKFKKNNVRSLI